MHARTHTHIHEYTEMARTLLYATGAHHSGPPSNSSIHHNPELSCPQLGGASDHSSRDKCLTAEDMGHAHVAAGGWEGVLGQMCRVGQNHIYTVCIR